MQITDSQDKKEPVSFTATGPSLGAKYTGNNNDLGTFSESNVHEAASCSLSVPETAAKVVQNTCGRSNPGTSGDFGLDQGQQQVSAPALSRTIPGAISGNAPTTIEAKGLL